MSINPYEAACGVKEGDIIKPGERNKLPFFCKAVGLDLAAGIRYSNDLGKPHDERTHQVGIIYQIKCERMVEHGTCPVINASDTIFQTPILT